MLFCLGMEPLVTHSHTHYQLHFVLFKLKLLVAKQHPISVYPPATVSDCLMIQLYTPNYNQYGVSPDCGLRVSCHEWVGLKIPGNFHTPGILSLHSENI